ncbi:MAG: hypothetical protein HZB79_08100 [Deltaproteobacteria bacterium]|nr:hypothetical protein [Deltaproteobacteria bacterium]
MNVHQILKSTGRFIASIGASFLSLIACPIAAAAGFPYLLLVWMLPAKVIAPIIAAVVSTNWVYGNPADENYWHQVSGGGFVIICAFMFWAVMIFLVWEIMSRRKQAITKASHA